MHGRPRFEHPCLTSATAVTYSWPLALGKQAGSPLMCYCVDRGIYHGSASTIDALIVDCRFGTREVELSRDVACPLAYATVDGWLHSMDLDLLAPFMLGDGCECGFWRWVQPWSLKAAVVHESKYSCPSPCRTAAFRLPSHARTRANAYYFLWTNRKQPNIHDPNLSVSARVRANTQNGHLRARLWILISSWFQTAW